MNFFSKKPEFPQEQLQNWAAQGVVSKNVEVIEHPEVDNKQIIEKIHNEFLTAGDRLLEEANYVLSTLKCANEEKAKKLHQFGFSQQPLAKEHSSVESTKLVKSKQQEAVLSMKSLYPTHKWITKQVALEICRKYNLILAEVNQYKGFVPDKNLNEISNFFDMYQEERFQYIRDGYSDDHGHLTKDSFYGEVKGLTKQSFENGVEHYSRKSASYGYMECTHLKRISVMNICAPIKDIELTKNQKVENNMVVKTTPPDPIVLLYKRSPNNFEGYLILTAWGDEASDPLVVNELNN